MKIVLCQVISKSSLTQCDLVYWCLIIFCIIFYWIVVGQILRSMYLHTYVNKHVHVITNTCSHKVTKVIVSMSEQSSGWQSKQYYTCILNWDSPRYITKIRPFFSGGSLLQGIGCSVKHVFVINTFSFDYLFLLFPFFKTFLLWMLVLLLGVKKSHE